MRREANQPVWVKLDQPTKVKKKGKKDQLREQRLGEEVRI